MWELEISGCRIEKEETKQTPKGKGEFGNKNWHRLMEEDGQFGLKQVKVKPRFGGKKKGAGGD